MKKTTTKKDFFMLRPGYQHWKQSKRQFQQDIRSVYIHLALPTCWLSVRFNLSNYISASMESKQTDHQNKPTFCQHEIISSDSSPSQLASTFFSHEVIFPSNEVSGLLYFRTLFVASEKPMHLRLNQVKIGLADKSYISFNTCVWVCVCVLLRPCLLTMVLLARAS